MGGLDGPWSIVSERDTHRPRLVVLSPFFLDATEVTVKMFRSVKTVTPARYWTGSNEGKDVTDFCTATQSPGPRENFPVSCVTRAAASAYCAAKGRTLPTEAQFEYASGGILGRRYVWGEDLPRCPDAIYSRTGWGILEEVVSFCRPPEPPGGPTSVGSGVRDRLELADGAAIVDLAGNVSELMLDTWNRHDEGCWSTPGIYYDPVCTRPSREGGLSLARGGDWASGSSQLSRMVRLNLPGGPFFSPQVGFRCAEAATE
jgi:formylglycine-generating enzyme required for sulfatase activity